MMNHIVHNIFNGKTRGRLNTNSEMVDINLFNANVITTAEYAQDLETSAEARYLRFMVPSVNTEDIYRIINGKETLTKFKCFTPYLIAWQHNHAECLIEKYNEYRKAIEMIIANEPNKGRISLQLSMIMVGFYSFCKFIESKEICTKEEADKEIQNLLIHLQSQAKIQVARSTDVRVIEKFKQYLGDAINSRRMNMAIVVYDNNGKYKSHHFTQQNNSSAIIWKYRKNSNIEDSIVYAVISFKALMMDFKRTFDYTITESLKHELADNGLVELDDRGNIKNSRILDPDNPGGNTKPCRAIIIPHSVLFPEEYNNDREPEGF